MSVKRSHNPFHLGIVIPVWKRADIATGVLRYFAALPLTAIRTTLVVVASPEDPEFGRLTRICKAPSRNDVVCVPWQNFPVSDKWNAAFKALERFDVDAACTVNSDMYVTAAYFEEACGAIRNGYHYAEATGLYFVDTASDEAFFARYRNMGVSAVMSRWLLERLSFEPFPTGKNKAIDFALRKRLQRKVGFEGSYRVQEHNMRGKAAHVDIKSYDVVDGRLETANINSFSRMKQSAKSEAQEVAPEAIFDYFFPELGGVPYDRQG